ncbi:hypothetical protein RFI_30812 [Reticulomyxa filosa]|uniref:Uncharacterized protein n=1 Tax=Reticulomyxa filosa TaxID=46433 RepID=X6M0S6_RETFI|nr:hypothetical protein RFI_30812 [Reticulomyxa filosa]|eukprot:ETO06580.1 hypothetical protein RFI_30812 [Reticulomyxa filosa]
MYNRNPTVEGHSNLPTGIYYLFLFISLNLKISYYFIFLNNTGKPTSIPTLHSINSLAPFSLPTQKPVTSTVIPSITLSPTLIPVNLDCWSEPNLDTICFSAKYACSYPSDETCLYSQCLKYCDQISWCKGIEWWNFAFPDPFSACYLCKTPPIINTAGRLTPGIFVFSARNECISTSSPILVPSHRPTTIPTIQPSMNPTKVPTTTTTTTTKVSTSHTIRRTTSKPTTSPIPCVATWSKWSLWSNCVPMAGKCGIGIQYRTRTCNTCQNDNEQWSSSDNTSGKKKKWINDIKQCIGDNFEDQYCYIQSMVWNSYICVIIIFKFFSKFVFFYITDYVYSFIFLWNITNFFFFFLEKKTFSLFNFTTLIFADLSQQKDTFRMIFYV